MSVAGAILIYQNLTFNIFNKIANKEKQNTFLCGLINATNIVRRRPVNNSKQPRSLSCTYKIRFDGIDVKIVCKNAFCSLLGVGKSRVERIISKLKTNIPSPLDLRGNHVNRPNKYSNYILFQIITHILSFPRRISLYSRNENDNKRFLSPELNVSKMYSLYLEKFETDVFENLKKGERVKPTVKY